MKLIISYHLWIILTKNFSTLLKVKLIGKFLWFSYLGKYYKSYSQERLKDIISNINKLNISSTDKYKLINFKPKDLLELSVVLRANLGCG